MADNIIVSFKIISLAFVYTARELMKKPTLSLKKWLEIRRKGEAKKKKRDKENPYAGFVRVSSPERFSLRPSGGRAKFLAFIKKIRSACLSNQKVLVDLSHTKRINSEATVLLHAELHRIKKHLPKLKLKAIPPRHRITAQAMKKIGMMRLLNTQVRTTSEANDKSVCNWHAAYGEEVDGEKSDGMLSAYEGVITQALNSNLYTKITEAMTNVHHHAYIENRNDGLTSNDDRKPWWMFSQERDGYLTVAFCDLGIGIPRSLPIQKPGVWKRLKLLGNAGKDSHAIAEAIKDSQTRTGEAYRGKGLKQIVDTVRSFETGTVNVYSNKGCYTSEMGEVNQYDYDESIMGTVISWQVPLPERAK